jgi:excisionase family DNA binding protein
MTVEVNVTNPEYWADRSPQLAQLLRSTGEGRGPSVIGDPTGKPPDPANLFAIVDPTYWSTQPRELQEALADGAGRTPGAEISLPGSAAGAGSASQARLTLSVEEAAAALGISRAFAYEAVRRAEIPHIRIGKRILIPKTALQRMLDASQPPEDPSSH